MLFPEGRTFDAGGTGQGWRGEGIIEGWGFSGVL